MWRIENGLNMGGPFLSNTIIDEENGRLIYLLAYVYAPELDKKALVNELEGSLKSFFLSKKEEQEE